MVLHFEFVKQDGEWYFHHPQYARRQGAKGALTRVYREGLHTLLEQVGRNATRVMVHSSDEPIEGGDELELTHRDKDDNGGYYLLKALYQQPYVLLIHFFDVRSFFGCLPPHMYIKVEVLA